MSDTTTRPALVWLGAIIFTLGVVLVTIFAFIANGLGNGGALVSSTVSTMTVAVWPAGVGLGLVVAGWPQAPWLRLAVGAVAILVLAAAWIIHDLQQLAKWSDVSSWWDRNPETAAQVLTGAAVLLLALACVPWRRKPAE